MTRPAPVDPVAEAEQDLGRPLSSTERFNLNAGLPHDSTPPPPEAGEPSPLELVETVFARIAAQEDGSSA